MKQYNLLKYIKLLKYIFHTLKYFNVLPRYIHIITAYIFFLLVVYNHSIDL